MDFNVSPHTLNMDRRKVRTSKQLTKSKQTVDFKKVLEIVEGGFDTQEINSAFDFNEYDILSSEDDSLTSEITSSDENQSGTEDEDPVIIPPSPKGRKNNNFHSTNNDSTVTTSTKCVKQHVQLTSVINQSHISELSGGSIFSSSLLATRSGVGSTFQVLVFGWNSKLLVCLEVRIV